MAAVCLVSHRLGGYDGVSAEAAKWIAAFRRLGWEVTRAAGFFAVDDISGDVVARDVVARDVVARGLWADRPGGTPPPVDHAAISALCAGHDLLVLDNAGSLWSAPEASVALERHALRAGIPTIVRHHDPAWQGAVPLHHPAHLHVVINSYTRAEFLARWPALAPAVVHNHVDVEALAAGDRAGTRASLGVSPDDFLILHPARLETPRKNIPGAVRFALGLGETLRRPVRYWLTDDSPAEPGPVADALARAPRPVRGHVRRQADMYAAADLVVLPSTWEGWGLPVIEAAAAGKLVAAGPYPVLDEIRALGVTVFDPGEVRQVADLLTDPPAAARTLAANRTAVRTHLDIRNLPEILNDLITRAHRTRARPGD